MIDHGYIIGRFVNQTILNNESLKTLKQLRINACQLTIHNFMQNIKSLNLSHVSLLLHKSMQTKNWAKSF
jgi:hypothetical protein